MSSVQAINLVVAGHVDHGKSTIIGRLLAETQSLPIDKIKRIQETCDQSGRPFEYSFIIDAFKDEQKKGITIDTARVFFKTIKRPYIIIDAPGHTEFLKNMISGASRAHGGLIVLDAQQGIKENTRRHGYMLSFLGIKQVAVLVNKMDLVEYSQVKFENIIEEFSSFLFKHGITPKLFLPLSGLNGDNFTLKSKNMSWHNGPTLVECLDSFEILIKSSQSPFRMPVQDIYDFGQKIVAGPIETGKIDERDTVVFYPSFKKSKLKAVYQGGAAGLVLQEPLFIERGELATIEKEEAPQIKSNLDVVLFWLSERPMKINTNYIFKMGTAKRNVKLVEVKSLMDSSELKELSKSDEIRINQVAKGSIQLESPLPIDSRGFASCTSRFVIVDDYNIVGGGLVIESKI